MDHILDVKLARWPIGEAAADYNGDGATFENVTLEAGITGARWSLAASFVDLTNDGWPDIHVANDFNHDTLYLNRGNGTFEQRFMGEESDRNRMSSEVQDLTRNGYLDIYVTNIEVNPEQLDAAEKRGRVFVKQQAAAEPRYFGGNNLWINEGDGNFVDRAEELNVKKSPFTWGWDALIIDLNNDRKLDIVHANNQVDVITETGDERIVTEARNTESGVWMNTGENEFRPIRATEIGIDRMNERVLASLDAKIDGRRDLLFVEDDGPPRFYRNVTDTAHHWFQLIIEGSDDHTALGARAWLTAGNHEQLMVKDCKSDFQNQNSRVLHWGLGDHERIDELHVGWPDDTEQSFSDLSPDRRMRVSPDGSITEVSP